MATGIPPAASCRMRKTTDNSRYNIKARSLSRANAKRLASIVDIMHLLETNPELSVAQSPVAEMRKDYRARNFFLMCSQELLRLAEAANDGVALASHELWQATLIHYNNGKKAAEGGIPGAAQMMEVLRPLFARTKLADDVEESPTTSADAVPN